MSGVNVNIVTITAALKEVVDGLQAIGVLSVDGTFSTPTATQDVAIATLFETIAVKFGLPVPVKIDKLIKALPLIIELAS